MSVQNSKSPTSKTLGSVVVLLVIISCTSKVFGFARDVILADAYGATFIADAFITTLSIPDILMDILAQTTSLGFVPLAIGLLLRKDDYINMFTSSVSKMLLTVAVTFATVLVVFPSGAISLLAPGFKGETKEMAIVFLRIVSLTILFRTVSSVLHSYLNAKKCFIPGAFMGVILDVFIIGCIFLGKKTGWECWLPIGAVLGTLFQMIFLYPSCRKQGLRLKIDAPFFTEDTKKMLLMIIPAAMSAGVLQITALVNKALASNIIEGGVTMLNYSNKISYFAENILVSSVATVLYPSMTEHYITGDMERFSEDVRTAIDKLIAFLIPVAGGLAVLSYEIIDILYGHGAFTEENVKTTSILMSLSVIGILGIGIQTLLKRALFSMQKIKVSIVVSSALLVTFVSFSYAFSKLFGLYGIALATGVSYIVGGVVYYIVICRLCGDIGIRKNLINLAKSLFCTAIMVGTILLLKRFCSLPTIPMLVICVCLGAVVYFALAQLVGVEDASLSIIVKKQFKK